MRKLRMFALGAAFLAIALTGAACGSGGGNGGTTSGGVTSGTTSGTTSGATTSGATTSGATTAAGPTLASTFVFGAPPDCATNQFCAIGLKDVYGIVFKSIKTTDFGGPITVQALKAGTVQVGELFSTSVYDPTFLVLQDDKHLEASDNIVPVIRSDKDSAAIKGILNPISAALTTDEMLTLNKQVDIGQEDPAKVAEGFLTQHNLLGTTSGCSGDLTVGVSGAFGESKIMAEMYGQALAKAGCNVSYQLDLESRKVSDAALFSGAIDLKPEYLASESTAQDSSAKVSGDPDNNEQILTGLLAKKKVDVLDFSPAVDQNVFVVTKDTASKFGLTKMSDLTKPASS
ncbi:MAG TPA: glycine betaine ABC transporter substrate-binding protein [Actinomycetota bacterium]